MKGVFSPLAVKMLTGLVGPSRFTYSTIKDIPALNN
jgi:hypothetical protein